MKTRHLAMNLEKDGKSDNHVKAKSFREFKLYGFTFFVHKVCHLEGEGKVSFDRKYYRVSEVMTGLGVTEHADDLTTIKEAIAAAKKTIRGMSKKKLECCHREGIIGIMDKGMKVQKV